MPAFTLANARKTIVLSLKSIESEGQNPTVTMYTSLTVGESRALAIRYPNKGTGGHSESLDFTLESVKNLIVKWDFVGEDGAPLEITVENLALLPDKAILEIAQAVQGGTAEEQKKSDATSQSPSTAS